MVTVQEQKSKESKMLVEEELKRINIDQLSAAVKNVSLTLLALGVIEIVFGVAALFSPAFAGAFFVLLLGGAVLVSGVTNISASLLQASSGRFALGSISAIAGVLIVGHPLFSLAFLAPLVGVYLLGVGITRFLVPHRNSLAVVNGVVSIVFGIVIFLALPNARPFLIGLLVGINVIINGLQIANTSMSMASPVLKTTPQMH
jgi:uncharacterized membrane protein HdeD (DUF308 family)